MSRPEHVHLGLWSGVLGTVIGIAAIVAMAFLVISPNSGFAVGGGAVPGSFHFLLGLGTLAMPALLMFMVAVYGHAPAHRKLSALLAIVYASIAVAISITVYAIQLTSVRQSLLTGEAEAVSEWAMHNFASPMFAVTIFGQGFLGLAALASAPVFEGGGLSRLLRYFLRILGAGLLLGPVAIVAQWYFLIYVMNMITSVLMPGVTLIGVVFFFRRFRQKEPDRQQIPA